MRSRRASNHGTDYIDLYQTHWPDHDQPYEETMEALDELIVAGKVRVIGCSNETSWGLMKSLETSRRLGVAEYQTIQNNFSMNNRRFEDELAQVCRKEGVSLIPYSPIAGGVLSGKYNGGAWPEDALLPLQGDGRATGAMTNRFVSDAALASTERFRAIADEAGISVVTLAVAWSKQHDFVASTIVGATKEEQLPEIFAASDLVLESDVMKAVHRVTREIPTRWVDHRTMEVGVFFTAGEGAIDIARVARAAEDLGFGSLWVGEHVVLPVDYERVYPASESGEPPEYAGLLSSPIVALARAAAVTTTLRVGTGVCLLPLHEPIAFAKDIATLDADSGEALPFRRGRRMDARGDGDPRRRLRSTLDADSGPGHGDEDAVDRGRGQSRRPLRPVPARAIAPEARFEAASPDPARRGVAADLRSHRRLGGGLDPGDRDRRRNARRARLARGGDGARGA